MRNEKPAWIFYGNYDVAACAIILHAAAGIGEEHPAPPVPRFPVTSYKQTANSKQQTANSKQQTANSKQQTAG